MRVDWLKKNNSEELLVIALGWGASLEVIQNQKYDDYDVVVICDYKQIYYDFVSEIAGYKKINLLAWSYGVWASEQIFKDIKFEKAVAIAGTPFMIDKKFGIDPRVWNLTLKVVLNEGVTQFVVRMCGDYLRHYMKQYSLRELNDVQNELKILDVEGRKEFNPCVGWTKFVACNKDLIVPARSVVNYAQSINCEVVSIDAPHYVYYDENFIRCVIKN